VRAASSDCKQPSAIIGTRSILAASMGNLLECYDFSVYAVFAIYIAENFFPSSNPGIDLIKAFLVFGLGFVARPLGGILIGVYGDRAGRKAALTMTILIMAFGTGIIALAPTYSMIGAGAPLLLLVGRILQGFSMGGEIGSATAFLVEHAPEGKKGLFAAWIQASVGLSIMLGALVAFSVAALPRTEIARWGWRIPFLIGLLIAPIAVYLRRTLAETPYFRAEVERGLTGSLTRPPLVGVPSGGCQGNLTKWLCCVVNPSQHSLPGCRNAAGRFRENIRR
jgi:MFS transporter, MHS family, proline/betaine transporter